MNTLLSLLLLLAIAAGLITTRKTIRLYFWAQLLYTVTVLVAVKVLGVHDTTYALIYSAVTLPILECCCFLIWEAQLSRGLLFAAVDFGLLAGIIASMSMGRHPAEDYVTFGEGVLLSVCGMALLLSASRSIDKLAVRVIGSLSLALSSFDFAYLLNMNWDRLNSWVPSILCTVAFFRIALGTQRQQREV